MPGTGRRRLSALLVTGAAGLLAIGCGGQSKTNGPAAASEVVDPVARAGVEKINAYLGEVPDNTEQEKTLLRTLNKNNEHLRNRLRDIECEIWKLKHPGQGDCPGGGSTPPTNVPRYPQ